jgi:hypothetical protein
MIDWTCVSDLREEVGDEDFQEVISLFVEEVESALAGLDPAAPASEDLHFLKGSALNLGFTALARRCAPPADPEELRACFAESKALFLAELPRRLAA